jgi:hypothetical protein
MRIPKPPRYIANRTQRQVFRFRSTEALGNVVIGSVNLLNLLKVATTASTAEPIFNGIKLHRISIWGTIASDLVPVSVSVEFSVGSGTSANIGNNPQVVADTSMCATQAAYVTVKPPKASAAGSWQTRGNTTAITNGTVFYLNGPVNSIIDIDLSYTLQNREVPPSALVVTGATVGQVLCGALDNGQFIQPEDNGWPYFG